MLGKIRYWFKNYWYYYKWPVIIIGFFIAVILFCVLQSGDRENYDANLIYTGPYIFEPGQKDSLALSLGQIMSSDYNEDGEKKVGIIEMPAFSDEQIEEMLGGTGDVADYVRYAPYTIEEVKNKFAQQVFAGQAVICLVDEYWYQLLLEGDGLLPMEEALGYKPTGLRDEYSVYFHSLDFASFVDAAGKLPEGTILCFRRMSTASGFTGKAETERIYENSKKMLRDLFAFKADD
ncbi:MAG: hypothetical protein E7618_07725 [Ruminococcaceae bacterium]|nr:hypothetical protein [Oscillospiraceae bacterium]